MADQEKRQRNQNPYVYAPNQYEQLAQQIYRDNTRSFIGDVAVPAAKKAANAIDSAMRQEYDANALERQGITNSEFYNNNFGEIPLMQKAARGNAQPATTQRQNAAPPDAGSGQSQIPYAPQEEPQNPWLNTGQQHGPGGTTESRRLGGVDANVETDQNGRVTSVFTGTPNSPGYGMIRLTGTPNQQAAQRPQPGFGYNQDAAQQAVNQYGGIGSVRQVQGRPDLFAVRGNAGGYGFHGSARDAALFGAPVFNSAHRVQDGPNETFLRYRAEERARRAAPQPVEQGPMGWKRLKAKADNESRERIADMTTRLGYSTDAARNALTQQQLAQQYALGLGQAGNDALRTQAAFGLNSVQMQQAMQQMRQQQMLDNARQTYATARPGSQEWIRARNTIQAYRQGGENEQKPFEIGEDVDPETGSKTKRYGIRTEDGIMPLQMTGGQTVGDVASMYANEKDWLDSGQIKQLNGIKDPKEREAAKQVLFLRHYGIGG